MKSIQSTILSRKKIGIRLLYTVFFSHCLWNPQNHCTGNRSISVCLPFYHKNLQQAGKEILQQSFLLCLQGDAIRHPKWKRAAFSFCWFSGRNGCTGITCSFRIDWLNIIKGAPYHFPSRLNPNIFFPLFDFWLIAWKLIRKQSKQRKLMMQADCSVTTEFQLEPKLEYLWRTIWERSKALAPPWPEYPMEMR